MFSTATAVRRLRQNGTVPTAHGSKKVLPGKNFPLQQPKGM